MDPNWVPKPNKINKNSNEICGKVQRIVSNTNAYNRISEVWWGGDDTPHGVFDIRCPPFGGAGRDADLVPMLFKSLHT